MREKSSECVLPNKIAVVGAGFVGSTIAYTLMLDDLIDQIALIDVDGQKAEGHALDLRHGMQFTRSSIIEAGDSFELVAGAQIVIVAAGAAQKPGQKRSELLEVNTSVMADIIPKIARYNSTCILLMVSNPLDCMTYLAYKLSGFDACRVMGAGTVLDTSRLRFLLGKELSVSPKDITAYVLGEHGDTSFAWWSGANIAGIPLFDGDFPSIDKENLMEQVHSAANRVISKKGATYYAISLVVTHIVRAILRKQSRVFTVSSVLNNYQGVSDICLSVPTIVRSSGVCEQLNISLDQQETVLFKKTVEKTKQAIEQMMSYR